MDAHEAPHSIGRYRIYGRIASGGMASVHFGRLVGGAGFSRTVAIKRLHAHLATEPDFVSSMMDEARLVARIHHPNVVPTLDVVATDDEFLLVMEYVKGESLSRLVHGETLRGTRIPLAIVSAIIIGVLHGLHAAHEATSDSGEPLGIVHRDISPQNILVGVDGVPRVIDFGVAKAAGRLQTTREGTIKGKIAYMAPEQIAGTTVTRAADIYAIGVVLWEVLAGRRLFHGDNEAATIALAMQGPKEPPSQFAPDIPPALDALVMGALAREPTYRFATAADMAERLRRIVAPAFSTEVGRWCQDAARESLAKRRSLLAEIESRSGMDAVRPRASSPGLAETEESRELSATRPDLRDVSSPSLGEGSGDMMPTLASQPSSLSLVTPRSRAGLRAKPMWLAIVLMVGGGGLLVGAGAAIGTWAGRSTSVVTAPTVMAAANPAPPVSTPDPPPSISTAPAPVTSARDEPASPAPSVRAVATTTRKASPPGGDTKVPPAATPVMSVSASRSPPAPPSCNPPYVIDSAGHRAYRPECL
jgi:eukaryotic-like serine/threonine-protein kinase